MPARNSPFDNPVPRPSLDPEGWLAAIVDSSDDAIISKTLDGIVTSWNRGAERIFGFTAKEMIGQPITKIIPDERLEEEPRILASLARGERVEHFETVRRRKDGKLLDISATISPVREGDGRIVGISKIARDITHSKRMQAELGMARDAAEAARVEADAARVKAEAARAEAERANAAKDNFLSILSHELRTPLTPALAAVSVIEHEPGLAVELIEAAAMARRNIETEARLVDDLLDLTRIAQGRLALHFETIDAHEAMRGVAAMFEREAEAKRITFHVALDATAHHVWADAGRLQQVLLNLISNAVKFTPEGGSITVTSAGRNGRLAIEVSDTGIGIDTALAPRIFMAFEQGDMTRARRFGGLGVGLSIANTLVARMGGTLDFDSRGKNQGTTFRLEMPLAPAAGAGADAARGNGESQPLRHRVLVVEDHADTRAIMRIVLERFGCSVTVADSVQAARELAQQGRFDLLICDFGLPDGTGADVIAELRRHQPIKAIAITGYGYEEDIRRSKDAGFMIHLTKPINVGILREAVQQAIA